MIISSSSADPDDRRDDRAAVLFSRAAVGIDGSSLDFVTGKMLALPMVLPQPADGDISRRLTGFRQAREFVVQEGVQALTGEHSSSSRWR